MTMPALLQYGTYTFPNETFIILDNPFAMDTPIQDIQRRQGGKVLDGYATPKQFRINGKLYGTNKGSVYNALNIMQRAVHNKGQEAALIHRPGWQFQVRLAPGGFIPLPEEGLYEFAYNIDILFATGDPCAESTALNEETGTNVNDTQQETINNAGHFVSRPFFQFVASTHNFLNDISVLNVANSQTFQYEGPIVAGQTLIVDCDGGCVLLQVGLTMVDAMSYIAGDLFMELEAGNNVLIINAACLDYTIRWRDKEYV